MADKTYTTKLGDTWDVISLANYGTELLTADLLKANFEHRKVLVFGSGTVLVIPDVAQQTIEDTDLPPWRRTA